jgi:molybdopterin-guanine dinucleotide biosynthesis protein
VRIIVAGLGRKSGKTEVVCRMIALTPEREWTAVKISHHEAAAGERYTLVEDRESGDSGRYAAAGAKHAYWLRGELAAALPELREVLGRARNWIVESGSAVRELEHDYAFLVVQPGAMDDGKLRGLLRGGEDD